jgi:hypothetical protein
MAIKRKLAGKAVKSTAKHTAHGTVSKLKREPARGLTLIGLGILAGALVGWLLGRGGSTGGSAGPTPGAVGSADDAAGVASPTIPPTATVAGGPS